jgi:DNA-binding transcriptional regulator YiaG
MQDDDVKQRICEAMRYHQDDWLARAEMLLDAHWCKQQGKKVYDVSTVGLRIRCAREHMGMSQLQLALRMDVPESAVGGWERGQRNLTIEQARKLSLILRPVCRPEWLFMKDDDGGPRVPVQLARKHDPDWYDFRRRKRAWQKAQAELKARNAARAKQLAQSNPGCMIGPTGEGATSAPGTSASFGTDDDVLSRQ